MSAIKGQNQLLDAYERNMEPYEIFDNGNYIIVQLSGEKYYTELNKE